MDSASSLGKRSLDSGSEHNSPPAQDNRSPESGRARACVACRESKVRCEQPDPNYPCRRCSRGGRECISSNKNTQSKRRNVHSQDFQRQVSSLQARIEGIASMMENQGAAEKNNSQPGSATSANAPNSLLAHRNPSASTSNPWPAPNVPYSDVDVSDADSEDDTPEFTRVRRINSLPEFIQTALREFVSGRNTKACYQRYLRYHAAALPAVVAEPGLSASAMCKSRPLLFLSMICATAPKICDIRTVKYLGILLARALTYSALRNRRESALESIQAFIIAALWYKPVDSTDSEQETLDLKDICHAAANAAVLSGLGGRLQRREGTVAEARTLLGCYYIHSNASMATKEVENILRWGEDTHAALELLDTSHLALPSDKIFCHHIRLQRATELAMPSVRAVRQPVGALDVFRDFENDLSRQGLTSQLVPDHAKTLKMALAASQLHVLEANWDHENNIAATSPTNQQPVSGRDTLAAVPKRLILARNVVEAFMAINVDQVATLPTIHLIGTIHAVIVLVQCTAGLQLLPSHMRPQNFSAEPLVDDIIEKLARASQTTLIIKITKLRRQLRQIRSPEGRSEVENSSNSEWSSTSAPGRKQSASNNSGANHTLQPHSRASSAKGASPNQQMQIHHQRAQSPPQPLSMNTQMGTNDGLNDALGFLQPSQPANLLDLMPGDSFSPFSTLPDFGFSMLGSALSPGNDINKADTSNLNQLDSANSNMLSQALRSHQRGDVSDFLLSPMPFNLD